MVVCVGAKGKRLQPTSLANKLYYHLTNSSKTLLLLHSNLPQRRRRRRRTRRQDCLRSQLEAGPGSVPGTAPAVPQASEGESAYRARRSSAAAAICATLSGRSPTRRRTPPNIDALCWLLCHLSCLPGTLALERSMVARARVCMQRGLGTCTPRSTHQHTAAQTCHARGSHEPHVQLA